MQRITDLPENLTAANFSSTNHLFKQNLSDVLKNRNESYKQLIINELMFVKQKIKGSQKNFIAMKIDEIISNIKTGNIKANIEILRSQSISTGRSWRNLFFNNGIWVTYFIFEAARQYPKNCPNLPLYISSQFTSLNDLVSLLALIKHCSEFFCGRQGPRISINEYILLLNAFLEKYKDYSTDFSYWPKEDCIKNIEYILPILFKRLFNANDEKEVNANIRIFTVFLHFENIEKENKIAKYLLDDYGQKWYCEHYLRHFARLRHSIKKEGNEKKLAILTRLEAGILASTLLNILLKDRIFSLFSKNTKNIERIVESLIQIREGKSLIQAFDDIKYELIHLSSTEPKLLEVLKSTHQYDISVYHGMTYDVEEEKYYEEKPISKPCVTQATTVSHMPSNSTELSRSNLSFFVRQADIINQYGVFINKLETDINDFKTTSGFL